MAVRTEAEYLQALASLLPPGPAWSEDQAAAVHAVLAGLAPEFARMDARADDLLREADPAGVTELVPDWERVMQLPDPCFGNAPTFLDRQAAVRDRLGASGGQSRGYFKGVAARLGFDVEIQENRPLRTGIGRIGERLCSRDMSFVWHVIEKPPAGPALPDMDAVYAARAAIECVFGRFKPAHTEVRFHYVDYLMDQGRTVFFTTEDGTPLAIEIFGRDDASN
ncbi:YmfQ family protein [Cupriavidus oxalaticus]|uniref:DUF2313 domain-containing protein n=1 Tax=Cupriavidus oxalaticus TaxID=96344 RepID=A0A4P7LJ29_9BURK|nr:putative phage tail protein [Cupriavidus oxalaticus]QBY56160.1 DUF2313 domain-containing protein [Cupriavidus oxalaticus]